MNRWAHLLYKGILALVSNVGCFVFTAFISALLVSMDPFLFSNSEVLYFRQYVVVPWGITLCLLRVNRLACEKEVKTGADVAALMVLLGWVTVPFILRFGWQKNSWISNLIMFMGIYAPAVEADKATRERYLNTATSLFALLGWVMGTTLLYCVATATTFTVPTGNFGYGIYQNKFLVSGHYYNTTGIIALCTGLMCLCGAVRARKRFVRIAYVVPFVLMTIVVVLTQSRTSRYALLAALALCAYGAVHSALCGRKWFVRQAAAICVMAVVLGGGYVGADRMTAAALEHMQRIRTEGRYSAVESIIPSAIAEDGGAKAEAKETKKSATDSAKKLKRGAGDLTFTGRTKLWGNIFRFWKENPKYMFIGYDPNTVSKVIAEGTSFSELGGVQAHNTYLQFTMEYGLIGMALFMVFAALMVRPILRLFFMGRWQDGYGILVGLVAAVLLVGMMESEPLISLSISNVPLIFVLALLAQTGREIN